MNLEELTEALNDLGLDDVLPNGFQIETDAQGQVIILTGLAVDEDSEELVDFVSDEEEDDEDEEDEEFDPDFEPLDEEDDDE